MDDVDLSTHWLPLPVAHVSAGVEPVSDCMNIILSLGDGLEVSSPSLNEAQHAHCVSMASLGSPLCVGLAPGRCV